MSDFDVKLKLTKKKAGERFNPLFKLPTQT